MSGGGGLQRRLSALLLLLLHLLFAVWEAVTSALRRYAALTHATLSRSLQSPPAVRPAPGPAPSHTLLTPGALRRADSVAFSAVEEPLGAVLGVSFSHAGELRASPAALARLCLWLAATPTAVPATPGAAAPQRHILLFEAGDALRELAPSLEAQLTAAALCGSSSSPLSQRWRRRRRTAGAETSSPPFLLGWGAPVGTPGGCRLVPGSAGRREEPPVALWLLGSSDALAQTMHLSQPHSNTILPCARTHTHPPSCDSHLSCTSERVRFTEAELAAAGLLPPAPDCIFLVGASAAPGGVELGCPTLAHFPAWLTHKAELYPLPGLARLRRENVRSAAARFSRTSLRSGR